MSSLRETLATLAPQLRDEAAVGRELRALRAQRDELQRMIRLLEAALGTNGAAGAEAANGQVLPTLPDGLAPPDEEDPDAGYVRRSEILAVFARRPKRAWTPRDVIQALAVPPEREDALRHLMQRMWRTGQLDHPKRGTYRLPAGKEAGQR